MLSTCCFYFSEDEAEIKSLWEDLFIYLLCLKYCRINNEINK